MSCHTLCSFPSLPRIVITVGVRRGEVKHLMVMVRSFFHPAISFRICLFRSVIKRRWDDCVIANVIFFFFCTRKIGELIVECILLMRLAQFLDIKKKLKLNSHRKEFILRHLFEWRHLYRESEYYSLIVCISYLYGL